MKKQIVNISPIQAGKVFALLYFVMSLPFVGFVAISFMATPAAQNSLWFLLGFPLGYLIFGFVFTTLAAWVYNLIAKWVGGIEYTSITLENT